MIPLTGYADRLSVRPGETISFHVSHQQLLSSKSSKVQPKLVRVICADPHYNGDGDGAAAAAASTTTDNKNNNKNGTSTSSSSSSSSGIQLEDVVSQHNVTSEYFKCLQEPTFGPEEVLQGGSHARIPLPDTVYTTLAEKGWTFEVTIYPTMLTLSSSSSPSPSPASCSPSSSTIVERRQTVASITNLMDVYLDSNTGRLAAQFGVKTNDAAATINTTQTNIITCSKIVPLHQWTQIWCAYDGASKQAFLAWQVVDHTRKNEDLTGQVNFQGVATTKQNMTIDMPSSSSSSPSSSGSNSNSLILAAAPAASSTAQQRKQSNESIRILPYAQHFNGKIENPKLWAAYIVPSKLEETTTETSITLLGLSSSLASKSLPPPIAAWDFSLQMTTQVVHDTQSLQLHGALFNAPTRAVRGSHWSGKEMCWRYAPEEYSAIHFHETDFSHCHHYQHQGPDNNSCNNWPICYQWMIPQDLKSGNYALLLEACTTATDDDDDDDDDGCQQEEIRYGDNIPFFVVPPKGRKQANVAVLVSTFTYVIYGNHARGEWLTVPNWKATWKEQTKQYTNNGSYPYNPREHPEYGWSTYNNHADGSGVSLASWHRPMLNLRIGYITFPYYEKNASGLRHYPADTHLTAWLEMQGIEYDIVTDWELHTEGSTVLEPYRVVVTGTHPEYHTEETWNAMYDYRTLRAGRIMYLGGNGFYWKIAISQKDHLLEIRRGEGGIRAWASEPGEYYHQLDGQYGGLWRRNGKAPQALVGVGFTAQGNFVGSYYRIHDNAKSDPRTAWMLEGITNDIIGNHGFSGHGAAGFELDRIDTALGTPEHAFVVASSEGHDPDVPWVLVFEERLTHLGNLVGVPDKDLIRSDIIFFETPNGGAVFSTGSITYCGSLLTNSCNNDISTLTRNVLLKFLDPNSVFSVPDQESPKE